MPEPRYGVTVPTATGRRHLIDRWGDVSVDSWLHVPSDDEIDAAVYLYEVEIACEQMEGVSA